MVRHSRLGYAVAVARMRESHAASDDFEVIKFSTCLTMNGLCPISSTSGRDQLSFPKQDRNMLKPTLFALMLLITGFARADNTTEDCWLELPEYVPGASRVDDRWARFIGHVCYNHGIYSVHESHIRERCNKAYQACAENHGGCFSYSRIGGGVTTPACSGHDGQAYPFPAKPKESAAVSE